MQARVEKTDKGRPYFHLQPDNFQDVLLLSAIELASEIRNLWEEKEKLKTELNETAQLAFKYQEENAALKEENKSLNGYCNATKVACEGHTAQLIEVTKENDALKTEVFNLRESIKVFKEQINDLQDKTCGQDNLLVNLIEQKERMEKSQIFMQEEKTEYLKKIDKLNALVFDSKEKVKGNTELTRQLKAMTKTVFDQKKQLDEAEYRINELTTAYQELEIKYQTRMQLPVPVPPVVRIDKTAGYIAIIDQDGRTLWQSYEADWYDTRGEVYRVAEKINDAFLDINRLKPTDDLP